MIKKAMILSTGFILIGLIGTAVTAPFAINEGIKTYNEITETVSAVYTDTEIADPVTNIKVSYYNTQDSYDNWVHVNILASPDDKIHISTQDNGFYRRIASVEIKDNTAFIRLEGVQNYQINKENINKAIASNFTNMYRTTLYLPERITLLSTEADQCHFDVPEGVNFQNADIIRKYGYLLTPEEIAEREAEEQEENRLEEMEFLLKAQDETIDNLQRRLEEYQNMVGTTGFEGTDLMDNPDSWFVNNRIQNLQSRIQEYKSQYVNQEITMEQYTTVVENLYTSIDDERTYLSNKLINNGTYTISLDAIQTCIYNILDKLEMIQKYALSNLTNQIRYDHGEITQIELDSLTNVINSQITDLKLLIEVECQTLEQGGFPTAGILENIETFELIP